MNFKNISNQELLSRLEGLARSERKLTHMILLHINEVASRKLFLELGHDSLYSYLTKGLKYSEASAYRRIQAARLLRVSPEVAEKLESGVLNLSQLTQMQRCLKEEKKKGLSVDSEKITEVLVAIENKNTFESEKILAKEFNQSVKTMEYTRPQKDESVRLEITFSREQYEILKYAKDLLSHQYPEGNWSEVITAMAEKFTRSKVGEVKTEPDTEVESSDKKPHASEGKIDREVMPRRLSATKYRPVLPVKVRRSVFARAEHRCEFTDRQTGQRCRSRFQLEVDHRRPLALGGGSEPGNLRVLCRVHNQRAWQMSLMAK
jgi:5-methylcytosine-specific restriction endonuclease McrA